MCADYSAQLRQGREELLTDQGRVHGRGGAIPLSLSDGKSAALLESHGL